jgi:hypothetical protein
LTEANFVKLFFTNLSNKEVQKDSTTHNKMSEETSSFEPTFQDWIKQIDTSDESIPSELGTGVEVRHGTGKDDTSSTESESRFLDAASRKRRIALIAGTCGIIVVGVAVAFAALIFSGVIDVDSSKSSSSSSGGGNSHDFDFTTMGTPAPTGTKYPSDLPSLAPSEAPSPAPSTSSPTGLPTISSGPSSTPTPAPTGVPSVAPTYIPTTPIPPVSRPPTVAVNTTSDTLLTFCVIADVPYNEREVEELPDQIATQMEGCEFLIHLGDIFIGDTTCDESGYVVIRDIMLESKIPTFIVPGDNEWNDCTWATIEAGWGHWTTNFLHFENYWSHNFTVVRQPGYMENFYFIHKRTLIVGLNIPGGRVHNATEWKTRLNAEIDWLRDVIRLNVPTGNADGVIFMAHAKPSEDHQDFFIPFRNFMSDELKNEYPVMYLHGDGHDFWYTPYFMNQPNFLRMQHEGGTNEPVLKILADPSRHKLTGSVYDAFQHDRQLDIFPSSPKLEDTGE